jgi:hypothetical protein
MLWFDARLTLVLSDMFSVWEPIISMSTLIKELLSPSYKDFIFEVHQRHTNI